MDINKIKKIAKEAGVEVMKYYHSGFHVEKKAGNQPVTEADLASNKIIKKGLSKLNFPILSEESWDDKIRLKSDFCWIVDPLDGTSDFVKHTDEFSVMIGLVKKNQPILGVVYEPVKERFYFAKKGKGAFLEESGNVKKIIVSKENDFSKMKILVSRTHLLETEANLAKNLSFQRVIQGSAGLKLSVLASGKAEIYINSSDKTSEWDTCAGNIILKEAGGIMTNTQGEEILYNQNDPRHRNGFLATNGTKHEEIVKELQKII